MKKLIISIIGVVAIIASLVCLSAHNEAIEKTEMRKQRQQEKAIVNYNLGLYNKVIEDIINVSDKKDIVVDGHKIMSDYTNGGRILYFDKGSNFIFTSVDVKDLEYELSRNKEQKGKGSTYMYSFLYLKQAAKCLEYYGISHKIKHYTNVMY